MGLEGEERVGTEGDCGLRWIIMGIRVWEFGSIYGHNLTFYLRVLEFGMVRDLGSLVSLHTGPDVQRLVLHILGILVCNVPCFTASILGPVCLMYSP